MRDASPRFSVRLGFDVTDDKRDKILEVLKERGLDELLVERMNEDGNCGSEIPIEDAIAAIVKDIIDEYELTEEIDVSVRDLRR